MNQRYLATLALQRPEHPRSVARDVCPHCKTPTAAFHFQSPDGVWVESHRCRKCGDVVPMRSAVANLPAAVWDGEGP